MNVSALHAAVAAVCPIVGVDSNGNIAFALGATAAQQSAAQAIVTSWVDPPPVVTYTFLQFMALFTPAEQTAFMNSADPQVKLFCMMAAGSGGLQMSNAEVVAGINYAVTVGILTQARATAVLAGQAPGGGS